MDRNQHSLLLMVELLYLFVVCSGMNTFNDSTDQSVLLALKAHIGNYDPQNKLSTNWSMATSVCDWMGITCSTLHHRVTSINIPHMGLVGSIPPHLGNLSFLVSLNISGNGFHGHIPQELAHMRRLKFMDLSFNNLSGEIPPLFGALSVLQYLHLDNNSLTGSIPPSLFNLTNLESLNLRFNSLQGQIPQEIGKLHKLSDLRMSHNHFTGSIPLGIFNISSLQYLNLSSNTLTDSLPSNICDRLKELRILSLSSMQLDGEIPWSLCQCPQLQILDLSFNSFSGSISRDIGNLTKLTQLYLDGNNLRGEIPERLGSLKLEHLTMKENKLSGVVPSSIYNISTLKYLSYYRNSLQGTLPLNLCQQLPVIQVLFLSDNLISGTIPSGIGNCTSLVRLALGNRLTGVIPEEIGRLSNLDLLLLDWNRFSGHIPPAIFNMSKLNTLTLMSNNLSGSLPSTTGDKLPNLDFFNLASNFLSGEIPKSISNASKLTSLCFSENQFTGFFPNWLGNLRLLEELFLASNNLSMDPSSTELSFLSHLSNCRHLQGAWIGMNPLNGILPASTGNGSSYLQRLEISYSGIIGSIPKEISNLSSLMVLDLSYNKISGQLPTSLGHMIALRYLGLCSNKLTFIIPASLWRLKDLLILDLSSNSFSGSLPGEIGSLEAVTTVNLSNNLFSGEIPSTIEGLANLQSLSLAYNSFLGPIPDSFGKIWSLQQLDLSHNQLFGPIPKSLENLLYLKYLNVSFNRLTGEIPSGGPFIDFTSQSFLSNEGLCGSPQFKVPWCPVKPHHRSIKKKMLLVIYILVAITSAMLVFILMLGLVRKYRRKNNVPSQSELSTEAYSRISYTELHRATDWFDETNLLGVGSYGSVYKGIFNGKLMAIKVFNLQIEGGFKSFDKECRILSNLRHRNLAKVITCCSNFSFKATVLEYMANGSLEQWLYSHNHFLDILQRLDITIDVACALDYLHQGYSVPVVHCDLKPSNVLLDENMVGHVSDFGISKMLGEGNSIAQTKTLATIGYMAPEYGSEGLVSTECDIYSYGIMLMETFTRMKPTDNIFDGELTLKSWVNDSVPEKVIEIIDGNLTKSDDYNMEATLHCATAIMELALVCTAELPEKRKNMKDVVAALQKIRQMFLFKK